MKLTKERSSLLKDFFVKGGVSDDRIVTLSSADVDPLNPIPIRKGAKGKRYVGTTYIIITKI